MRIEPLGDAAFILRDLSVPAFVAAAWLDEQGIPGLIEAVASYDTVGIFVEPGFQWDDLVIPDDLQHPEPRLHRIPVCYRLGDDLAEASDALGLDPDEIADLHTSVEYACHAVGFCPGFGYLGNLPDRLAGLPRRDSPRTRVEPGSVAITGIQTAVYPLARPGGWNLIGRSPLTLVEVAEGYFPLRAGHQVRFVAISEAEFESRRGERL